MLKSAFVLALLSLQGIFAGASKEPRTEDEKEARRAVLTPTLPDKGGEGRAVAVGETDSRSRSNALPGYHALSRVQKRQEDGGDDNDGAKKQFSLPAAQSMAGDLSIVNMKDIEAVDMPRLETVDGNLTIAANSNLETLALPALRRVGGNLVLDGAFTAIDLPALDKVGGVISVSTWHSSFNCTAFKEDLADVDVGGDFLCQGPSDDDDDDEEDEDGRDGDNEDNAGGNEGDDEDDGVATSGAAGPPRFGWLALLAGPVWLML